MDSSSTGLLAQIVLFYEFAAQMPMPEAVLDGMRPKIEERIIR
jgi:hypothetical protein